MIKVHLGGTCGNSNWRDKLILLLNSNVKCINPVVTNWVYNDTVKSEKAKRINECDILLYVITPQQKGFTSIASAVDYSNKFPNKLVFCILSECNDLKFEGHLLESIRSVEDIIKDNGCRVYDSLEDVANYLNNISD